MQGRKDIWAGDGPLQDFRGEGKVQAVAGSIIRIPKESQSLFFVFIAIQGYIGLMLDLRKRRITGNYGHVSRFPVVFRIFMSVDGILLWTIVISV
jgi:hypothetical protein